MVLLYIGFLTDFDRELMGLMVAFGKSVDACNLSNYENKFNGNCHHLVCSRSNQYTLILLLVTLISFANTFEKLKCIWKLFLRQKVFLTKDNLGTWNWHGCKKCCFSNQDKTIQNFFIDCPFTRTLWCKMTLSFNESLPLLLHVISLANHWIYIWYFLRHPENCWCYRVNEVNNRPVGNPKRKVW
jgi:hypothetical protein